MMGFLDGWKAKRLAKEYVNIAVLHETVFGLKSSPDLNDTDRAAFEPFEAEWKQRLQAVADQITQRDPDFITLWLTAVKTQFARTRMSAMIPVLERVIAKRFGPQFANQAKTMITDPSRLNRPIDGPMIRLAQLIADRIDPAKK